MVKLWSSFMFVLLMSSAWAQGQKITVIDGDTVHVDGQTYRLVGYNTPETFAVMHPCPAEKIAGATATRLLEQMVPEMTVERVPCWGNRGRDKYGRWCGHALYQGREVSEIMIAAGIAERLSTTTPQTLRDWCKRP